MKFRYKLALLAVIIPLFIFIIDSVFGSQFPYNSFYYKSWLFRLFKLLIIAPAAPFNAMLLRGFNNNLFLFGLPVIIWPLLGFIGGYIYEKNVHRINTIRLVLTTLPFILAIFVIPSLAGLILILTE